MGCEERGSNCAFGVALLATSWAEPLGPKVYSKAQFELGSSVEGLEACIDFCKLFPSLSALSIACPSPIAINKARPVTIPCLGVPSEK